MGSIFRRLEYFDQKSIERELWKEMGMDGGEAIWDSKSGEAASTISGRGATGNGATPGRRDVEAEARPPSAGGAPQVAPTRQQAAHAGVLQGCEECVPRWQLGQLRTRPIGDVAA
jgi:hypothetical protein